MTRRATTPLAERGPIAALAALLLTGAGTSATMTAATGASVTATAATGPSVAATARSGPAVTVTRQGDRLDVEVEETPLSVVLDAVAEKLGVSVEYEGAPPQQPVTLTLRDRSPAEAMLWLLDGTGVDYALQLDASGQGVVRLLVQTGSSDRSTARAGRPTPAGPVRRAPREVPTPPPIPEFPQPFDPAQALEEAMQDEGADDRAPAPQGAPTPRPGRPAPAPLLFPEPLLPQVPTPTPTPQPQQD